MAMKIRTNHVPRPILDGSDLSAEEREWFDYVDWQKVAEGSDSVSFFRYKGTLYDLHEFMPTQNLYDFTAWHGYQSDSFFSGILVKYTDDHENVIVGTYYS